MPHAAFEGAAFGASGGRSSVGRAPALQAGGRRFDSDRLHQFRQAFPAGISGRRSADTRGKRNSLANGFSQFRPARRSSAGPVHWHRKSGSKAGRASSVGPDFLPKEFRGNAGLRGLVAIASCGEPISCMGAWLTVPGFLRGLPAATAFSPACDGFPIEQAQEGRLADALALRGDEGRGTLR